jgi:hypothetical protein
MQKVSWRNLLNNEVTESKIANLAVTESKIANLAVTEGKVAAAAVAQAKLKTTTGEVSVGGAMGGDVWVSGLLTLPGGSYGFYPQLKVVGATAEGFANIAYSGETSDIFDNTTYATYIRLAVHNNTGSPQTVYTYAQQRYVTASGKDHWIFLLRDKLTKKIIAGYQAPDHPCANTQASELVIPHPFGSYDKGLYEVMLVDNNILNIAKSKTSRKKSLLMVINEDFVIEEAAKPKFEPREIIMINEYPDEPVGEVVEKIKSPSLEKEITLEKRIIEALPLDILFKKMVVK